MPLFFGPSFALTPSPKICRISLSPIYPNDIADIYPMWCSGENMSIPRKDIAISQHDDIGLTFNMLDADEDPLDISGFTSLTWIIAGSVTGTIYLTKTTTNNTLLTPNAFTATALITKAESGALPPTTIFPETKRGDSSLYHEFKGVNSGGRQRTMLRGKLYVEDTRISDA